MIHSKKSLEGYVMIDHRASPGIPPEVANRLGIPKDAGQGLYEGAFIMCNHCQNCIMVVIDPLKPTDRIPCSGCNRYICNACEYKMKHLGERCKTFDEIADEICENAVQQALIKEI
jgi:hypothetical protein